MKKFLQLVAALIMVMVLSVACSNGDQEEVQIPEETQNETSSEPNEQEAEAADYPVTFKDALDNEIKIDSKPERIVSLIPSNTEIAYALGAGEQVVGVTDFDNYPEEVLEKEKIGGMEINLEKIISLQPDLVLAHASTADSTSEGLQQLRDAGATVVVVHDTASFDDVYKSIELIGMATGSSEKANDIVSDMKKEIELIKEKAKTIAEGNKKKVFVEVGVEPEIYTTGTGTFMHEMLEIIGADNVASDVSGWQPMTEEAIVEKNPDVIVITYGYYTPDAIESVLSRDGWEQVTAVSNKQVVDVHSDLVTRAGPRLIEGVKALAKAVYPDVYSQ